MPPRKQQEEVIFLVNTGRESAEILENEDKSFLDKAKMIMKQILERKIFLKPNDLVNVICFGSNETENEENMDNIRQFSSEVETPTWEMVQKVLDLQSTQHVSSWVEGLHVTLNFVKEKLSAGQDVKVIIINNFKEDEDIITQFDADDLARQVIASNVKLMFISCSDFIEEIPNNLNSSQKLAAKIYHAVVEANASRDDCCAHDQIDNYLLATRFYKTPPKSPLAWKCLLEIGNVKIPIATYVKITEPPAFPSWKLTTRSDSVGYPPESEVGVTRTTENVDRHRNVTEDPDNIIKGYKYGGSFIPFSDNDSQRAKFKDTEKSLIVRGFVKQTEVPLEHWFGKGAHIIVPHENMNSKNKFYALLACLKKAGLVAIVRKVYQQNAAPKMGILFPRLEEGEIACFVHIGIPYIEERRVLKPKEEVSSLNEEMQRDVEDYIDSMTLPQDDERCQPGNFCNPFKQHKWDYLSHRALNRDPLPPMDQYLIDLISAPNSLVERSQPALERLSTWVKSKPVIIDKIEADENKPSVNNVEIDDIKAEEENMMKAAEEAEIEIKKKEEIFNDIVQSTMVDDDDLFNDL